MIAQVYSDDNIEVYRFLSTDEKPLSCKHGSRALEIDTGRKYIFDAENSIWQEVHDSDEDRPVDAYTKEETQALLLTKVDKVSGMGLSQESYTTAEKQKLAGIEAGATAVTVDSALSPTSTNPVQNQAVYADKQKQDAALAEVENKGAKNLFPITASGTQTIGGVVFTVNSDGTITANGTKTNNDWLILSENNSFGAGTYTLSDGLPVDTTDCQLIITTARSMTAAIMATAYNARPQTKTFNTAQTGLYYAIRIASGKTVSNLTFKPMLCTKAEWDISHTYVPYGKTNVDLTNENANQQLEIDYAINTGVKNLLPMTHTSGSITRYGVTCTWDVNAGTMTINGTHSSGDSPAIFEFYDGSAKDTKILPAGSYTLTGCPAGGSTSTYRATLTQITGAVDVGNGATFELSEPHYAAYRILISGSVTFNNMVFKPMIRPAYITDPTYEPYALSNPVLTPTAIKAVDEGAKNLFEITATTQTINGVTFTVNADQTITMNGTSQERAQFLLRSNAVCAGMQGYILSGAVQNNQDVTLRFQLGANPWTVYANDSGSGSLIKNYDDSSPIQVYINVPAGVTVSNLIFKPMICTASDWAVSQKFVPYTPTNRELYEEKIGIEDVYGPGTKIGANTNLNDLKTHGIYYSTSTQDIASFTNCPVSAQFTLSVRFGSQSVFQEMQPMSKEEIMYRYVRMFTNGTWGSWYKFEGTPVT